MISGNGIVRHADGTTPIVAGDAFIFEPDQPHQLTNDGSQDYRSIHHDPIGESCYYPDSKKWLVRSPQRRLICSEPLEHYDAEE